MEKIMITKETKITEVTISELKIILWKEITYIIEDGKVITTKNHRNSASPSEDKSGLPDEIKIYADLLWIPEVIQNYNDKANAGVPTS